MAQFILYHTEDENSKINLTLENGMIWLTQLQIAELFQTTKQTISKQIKNMRVYNILCKLKKRI